MREILLHIKRQRHEHSNKWELAMEEQIKALDLNNTWDLVELPKERKAIPTNGYKKSRPLMLKLGA